MVCGLYQVARLGFGQFAERHQGLQARGQRLLLGWGGVMAMSHTTGREERDEGNDEAE